MRKEVVQAFVRKCAPQRLQEIRIVVDKYHGHGIEHRLPNEGLHMSLDKSAEKETVSETLYRE
ncbi:hypothetical protein NMB33_36265 (plasmid) [Burkholderia sp. FXe9]|nr:hypothetical protein NMB33_36265 [Burkholderia sp. FXe9]